MGNHTKTLRNLLIAAGILVAVLFVIVALIAANLGQSASESFRSQYHYELKVSTTGPIEDAVLLIPLPSRYDPETGTNVTPINPSQASLRNFDGSGISMGIENVRGVPMLNISADRIDPIYKNRITPMPILPGQNESELPKPTHVYSDRYSDETPVLVDMELYNMIDADPDCEIETRTPIGTEPLLAPYRIVGNLTGSDAHLSPGSSGYIVEVPFILSFEADDENVLTIAADLQGRNEWWVMGWQFNSYQEQVRHEFTGPCNGTYLVRGTLVTGEGVY
ncbi:hypothetical protein SZ63_11625 [Methanoculleus sediminis]|uniref:Uncharacterized protein n=1 Tax=Methanoculleus sediminis TaxID=1550566 RepID=A0A0H1QWB2_9EURY|nr:hypothetical protein [Methanoculleus sediminis]KLK87240.1 hypothetical protein SZ63_11625 [Methanoculleus sediminis]